MLFLGLDPGSRHTGFGLVEQDGSSLRPIEWGTFSCPRGAGLPARLAYLTDSLRQLLERHTPAAAALETPFHGLNARSLIVLAQARGALLATLAERRLEIREYSPAEVKSAVTGSGRADKQQVARMVGMVLAVDAAALRSDASDALAVAICCAHRRRSELLVERAIPR